MAAEATTNGKATQVPEGWLPVAELQRKHGGSVRTIHRWATEGRVSFVTDKEGRRWFDPEGYARELSSDKELEPDQAALVEVRRDQVVLDSANSLLKQAQSHHEKTFGPYSDATREVLELLRQENKDLRAQNAELVKVHLDNVKAREEMLSQAHERELAGKMFLAAEERKREALETFKGPAKELLKRFVAGGPDTVPAPASTAPKLEAARRLLGSLTDQQLLMLLGAELVTDGLSGLLGTGVLSAEQEAMVREVLVG